MGYDRRSVVLLVQDDSVGNLVLLESYGEYIDAQLAIEAQQVLGRKQPLVNRQLFKGQPLLRAFFQQGLELRPVQPPLSEQKSGKRQSHLGAACENWRPRHKRDGDSPVCVFQLDRACEILGFQPGGYLEQLILSQHGQCCCHEGCSVNAPETC